MGKNNSKSNKDKEISISKKIKSKFNFKINNKAIKFLIPILFIIFAMSIGFYVRSGPINLSGINTIVTANTYNQVKSIVINQVNQQYPNLGNYYKNQYIQKELLKINQTGTFNYRGRNINVKQLISQNVQNVKSQFKGPNDQTYLIAIDPYFWIKGASEYLKTGYYGNELKTVNSKKIPWISYRLAPTGVKGSYSPPFQVWIEAKIFEMSKLSYNSPIDKKIKSVFLLPVILAILSVIPLFFIIKKFSNNIFALFGSLFLMTFGIFVSRTVAGFVDTDGYNVLFPLIIAFFLIYAFYAKKKYITSIFAIIAGFFQGLFLWIWGAGWFFYIFSFISLLFFIIYIILVNIFKLIDLKNLKEFKLKEFFQKFKKSFHFKENKLLVSSLNILISFSISSSIFAFIYAKGDIFTLTIEGLKSYIGILTTIATGNIWPNVLSSVAELAPASFSSLISNMGGKFGFLIALIGILFLTLDFKKENKHIKIFSKILAIVSPILWVAIIFENLFVSLTANHQFLFLIILFSPIILTILYSGISKNINIKIFLSILLSSWFAGTIFMSFNGVRFILLLIPIFSISFAIGLYYLSNLINYFIQSEFKIKNEFFKPFAGIVITSFVFLLLFMPVFNTAQNISKGTYPNFGDGWYQGLNNIRLNSSSNAIITSWWDFGHFFAMVSNRSVTFDGASQNSPQAFWVGNLLLQKNDSISRDILKMLSCSANSAFTYIENISNDITYGVHANQLIYSTFGKVRNEKLNLIKNYKYYNFSKIQVQHLLNLIDCKNPHEDFLITSQDMISKAAVWGHWGSWNFTKKYVYDNYNKLTAKQISKNLGANLTTVDNLISQLRQISNEATLKNINKADLINQWLAPYPNYIQSQRGGFESSCSNLNKTISCNNGITINLQTEKVTTNFVNSRISIKNLIYPKRDGSLKKIIQNPKGNVDILVMPSLKNTRILLVQPQLSESLFTKLFFLGGFGTTHFQKFTDITGVTGDHFIIWKVLFNDTNKSLNLTSSKNISKN